MAGKIGGYILGGLQIVVGALVTILSAGTLSSIGVPLMVSGAAAIAATALTPGPPRTKTLRDSPTYGIDTFNNPRGPDTLVPVVYGEPKVLPAVIAEAVTEAAEGVSPGDVRNTKQQEFRWLGVVAEGEIASVSDIRVNDRSAVSERREASLGKGTGTKREFDFPALWVFVGDDEAPDVEVRVDGVLHSWSRAAASAEFVVPSTGGKTYDLKRDARTDRIVGSTLRVFVRGPGLPETEQLRDAGTYRWSAQKLSPRVLRLKWKTKPPAGHTVRLSFYVLETKGLAIAQDGRGRTTAVFGTPPLNGAKVTAAFRTTPIHGLRVTFRPGTVDQPPADGFTDLETSRNPTESRLARGAPVTYATSGREVDDARVGIAAPGGLVQYHEEGGTRAVSVDVRIEWRRATSDAWKVLRSGGGDKWTLVGERSSNMRFEVGLRDSLQRRAEEGSSQAADELAAFGRGPLEVRVTRLTAESSDPMVSDAVVFSYVTEVLREGFSYPGTSVLGLSGRVAAFLGSSSIRVSCRARRADLFDPRTAGGSRDIGSPFNPALAIRDLVTSSEGAASERFGGGSFFAAADLWGGDDPAALNGLAAFADWCDEWVHRPGDDATLPASATNGERRCRLSVVLDTPSSLMETVGDLAFLGYCFAVLQGARWRFPLDRDGDPVAEFDEIDPVSQSAWNAVVRMDPWGRTPSAVQGSFWNEAIDFARDELLVPVAEDAAVQNVREVDLRGVTRETEAARMLRHLAEQSREMPYTATWDAHPGRQRVEAGDIVSLRTRIPYSTGATATTLLVRVLAAVVARDENGALSARFAGRVLARNAAALKPATVPVSARRPAAATPESTPRRAVTSLTARIE